MARADKQFYENQAKQLNDYLAGVRSNILSVASGGTVDMQIAQVTQKYQDAMKELANIQSPQFVRGMSEEEYQKEYAAYEQFLVNRAELEKQIQQNLQDEIKKIREDATKQQLDRFNQTLNEQYAEDLSKAADNERKKLELENEMLQKQIEARKAAGEKTYEQEAQLRANNLRLQQMDLDKELAQAELNHKSKYEIRKGIWRQSWQQLKETRTPLLRSNLRWPRTRRLYGKNGSRSSGSMPKWHPALLMLSMTWPVLSGSAGLRR